MTSGSSTTSTVKTVALIGGRGHTGGELIAILQRHPSLSLALATSRELAGQRVADHVDGFADNLIFSSAQPEDVAREAHDVAILALPNGASQSYVEAIDAASPDTIIIDLSADHRFDAAWAYGLPEHFRDSLERAKRIANPGCYATAMQLAIRPVLDLVSGPPVVFGVSGYSGAGTTPSDKNNPEKLRDNLMPYQLAGHMHEREVSHHLGRPVRFHPHVASFFRGIALTISLPLHDQTSIDDLDQRYLAAYLSEPLVKYISETPFVRDIARQPYCTIGGLTVHEMAEHAVVIATIDNLLKGAATQAVQNLNLACGFDEFAGLI